ncbi:MAG: DUF6596 domain-containing protein [Pseudomonadota bacterium]
MGRDAQTANRVADLAARRAYGRLLASLCQRTCDVAAAEDALADAFAIALHRWAEQGVPDSPEAWLLQVARRKLVDSVRRAETRKTYEPDAVRVIEALTMVQSPGQLADHRLALLFTCAHPAIDPSVRTPLMLQTVLGLEAARIASVFLVSTSAMAQRLVRAKTKIKAAGIPFVVPEPDVWPVRLDAVLSAIYAAYTAGWNWGGDGSADLADEAEWLARLVCEFLPETAEAHALVALILYCESRRPARTGAYVPLSDQDTDQWDQARIEEADTHLRTAARLGPPGRYQFEAAIQSVHADRQRTGQTNWSALLAIYDALCVEAPSLGAEIARAAVLLEARGPIEALKALDALPSEKVGSHAPYWATRAHALKRGNDMASAHEAFGNAIALTPESPARGYLEHQRDQCFS